jgi:hypothetical protein
MTILRFDYDSGDALHHPDLEVECVPQRGDVICISGVRHIVTEREFWIDHGLIEYVELHLKAENS